MIPMKESFSTSAILSLVDRTKAAVTGWQVCLFLTTILSLCYASVLVTSYGFSDDYPFFVGILLGGTDDRKAMIAGGRPTYALLTSLSFAPLNAIGDLRYLRLLGVVGITLLAGKLYRTLVLKGWDLYQSFLLAVIICTLPPFQIYAAWAFTAFAPFAALLASLASSLAEQAFGEPRPLYRCGFFSASVLLLLLALTIYQPAAMFFWVFAAISVFQPDTTLQHILRRFLWYLASAFTGLILGFGVQRLGMAIYGADRLGPGRSRLTLDLWGKVSWFFEEPLLNALNVVNIFPTPWLACSITIFIGGGLLLYFRGGVKERLLQSAVALTIIFLSYLPNLVVAENWASYRTQVALTSVIVVYAFLALWGYGRLFRRPVGRLILTAGLGIVALASSFLAAWNVSAYFAIPQSRELELMRARLVQPNLADIRSIYIICARWYDSIAPGVRYDEFGLPSSAHPWSPAPMVYLLLREKNSERADIPIEIAPANGPADPPPDALVMDMRELLKPSSAK